MDGKRFDVLAKLLGTAVPRQTVLRLLVTSAASLAALSGIGGDAGKKHRRRHKKRKRRRERNRRDRLCPSLHDRVCHCPPGNLDNCHTTGNGAGHENHPLDCCCTINGEPDPECECPNREFGSTCCSSPGTTCANDSQCCNDGFCCNIEDGIGACQADVCCIPLTCADFPGLCGPQDNGCDGQTPDCPCESGQICTDGSCCTPLTCADDSPDQCGTFADGCGNSLVCACGSGGCCDGVCMGQAECCTGTDCEALVCQVAACNQGECEYTPVEDGEQGPLCDDQGEFCCDGDACCQEDQVCTANGCCTPLTCADFPGLCGPQADGCGGQTPDCTCQSGPCCDGSCISDDQCCEAGDCPPLLCQIASCVEHECDYSPVSNNEPGPLCTGAGEFCCNGDACCEAGDVCLGSGCCTPLTCADIPGRCGPQDDGCGGLTADCTCTSGSCCGDICITGDQCCASDDCAPHLCQVSACVDHTCDYTPVGDGEQGPLCTEMDQFCCNGEDCCNAATGDVCLPFGCCTPETMEEACAAAGRVCGPVSDGCGGEYDCGVCPIDLNCAAGVCLPAGGKRKRCIGHGLAGQPCKGKKCRCKGGRRCHKKRCCEPIGDGSRHCNANSDCCPGLSCVRRETGQHKVCVRKSTNAAVVAPTSE